MRSLTARSVIDQRVICQRNVSELASVQGLTHAEAAGVLGISTKSVQCRINRSLILVWKELHHLRPA
jgi:DNA-directed RNA polymerase specialized sigma24 family protein